MSRSAVPRRWPGSTIVCLGAGPSLCAEDLSAVRSAGFPRIAINNAIYADGIPPDVLYSSDVGWWRTHADLAGLAPSYTIREGPLPPANVVELDRTGQTGLELEPTGLKTGGHSGYAAVNLAVHLGARKILLLGYDMQPGPSGQHHFLGGDHADGRHPRYAHWLRHYEVLRACLTAVGIGIANCSRETAITGIPRMPLAMGLEWARV